MHVKVNWQTCTGCKICVATCPNVFEMVADKAYPSGNPVQSFSEPACLRALDHCPTKAIKVCAPRVFQLKRQGAWALEPVAL